MHTPLGASLPLAIALATACAPTTTTISDPSAAQAALQAAGSDYAALEGAADSLAAAADEADVAPSERAQATARELALRLGRVRGNFETVTSAMTTRELEQTESLWLRLAMSHAALELLREEAGRLSQDPTASPAELHDLATQLSAALELALTCSQLAAQRVRADSTTAPPSPPTAAGSQALPPDARRGQVSVVPRLGIDRPA